MFKLIKKCWGKVRLLFLKPIYSRYGEKAHSGTSKGLLLKGKYLVTSGSIKKGDPIYFGVADTCSWCNQPFDDVSGKGLCDSCLEEYDEQYRSEITEEVT